MLPVIALWLVGLFLSSFFSGSETGFYRATRVRLMLDALGGDLIARVLLWLTNNPALFVATTLIGNNFANYLTARAIVLGTQHVLAGREHWFAELAIPILLSPVLFVYGELLPKNMFYYAPNRLLRRAGPLLLLFTILFSPVSAVLWSFGRLLQTLVGEAPLRVQLTLARKELQQVLQEGQDAGILQPAQRYLAQSLCSVASQPVVNFCRPVARVASVRLGAKKSEVLRLARRHGVPILPVAAERGHELVGYLRVVDLYLSASDKIESATTRPLLKIGEADSHVSALIRMQSKREEMARVVNRSGETIGLLYAEELTAPLFREKAV